MKITVEHDIGLRLAAEFLALNVGAPDDYTTDVVLTLTNWLRNFGECGLDVLDEDREDPDFTALTETWEDHLIYMGLFERRGAENHSISGSMTVE